jgi:hypothetical protein
MFTTEMASGSVINIPRFMKVGVGVQVTLRFLSQKVERLQCWYY